MSNNKRIKLSPMSPSVVTRSVAREAQASKKLVNAARKWLMSRPVNDVDPITLEPFDGQTPVFVVIQENGRACHYDALELTAFFYKTATWNDPLNNEPMNIIQIRRLEKLIRSCGDETALVEAFQNPRFKEEDKFRERALNDMDDLCGNLVSDALIMVDDTECTCNEFISDAAVTFFPVFDDYYRQMSTYDIEFALQAVLKYITISKGDPHHPRTIRNRKWMHVMDFLFAKVVNHVM